MSPNNSQSPKRLPQQPNDLQAIESQIDGLRQQITYLQRELTQIEEQLRDTKHQPAVQASVALSAPAAPHSAQRVWTLPVVAVLSLLLAYGGQFILLQTVRGSPREGLMQALAGGMLITGALLFGAFMPRVSTVLSRLNFPVEGPRSTAFVQANRWTFGWLSASVTLAAIALLAFATLGESAILVLIWLISILALLISQIEGKRNSPRIAPQERIFLVALMGLLLITLITRVYRLTTLPYNFDGDYASVGLEARALITGQRPIFSYGWAAIPILGYLPAGLTLRLFGDNLAGLNASGVIEGLLIIIGVYLLGRDLFQARVGLIGAALLTISYAHMAASRQSVYFDPVLFLVFAIYFLLVGLREGRGWAIVTSGLLTAFCALVYFPSRIIVFIVGFMLFYLFLFHRNWLRAHWWTILLWVLAVLVTLGPMLVVFARDMNAFMSRTREVFILNPEVLRHARSVYQVEAISNILLEQARRSVLLFHYYPDTGTQFGFRRPLLDPFTAPLFTLGMGIALFNWRRFGSILALVWIVLGVLTGSFLTVNPPFWARLMILLPPAVLLAALALNTIYELVKSNLEEIEKRVALIAPAAVILLIVIVGVWNWNTYIELKGNFATARTRIARYLADQPDSAKAYLVSNDFNYRDREFEFLAPGRLIASLTPEQMQTEIPQVGASTLVILSAEQGPQVQQLQQLYPNGTTETHLGNSPNEIAFYVFRLP